MNKFRQYIQEYGFIKFILKALDNSFYFINKSLRDKFYRWTKDDFGFKEALFWSKDIALYLRYSKILGELRNIILNSNKKIHILDVGSGGEGIARFLKYSDDYERYDISLVDSDKNKLKNIKLGNPVIADGCNLPFKDNTFDVVVSVDTLEHTPKDKREKFLKELKRVSKNIVLLHFVIHDPDRQFLGRVADLRFQKWYMKNFGKQNLWTAEHLKIDPPNYQEIDKVLSNALIIGTQNVETWFNYMTLGMMPILGFFTGFLYILKWKKKDNFSPFHGCFVKWIKGNKWNELS